MDTTIAIVIVFASICFAIAIVMYASFKQDVARVKGAQEKLIEQIRTYNKEMYGIDTPYMPPIDFGRLNLSFWQLLTGKEISFPPTSILDLTAIVDPVFALYMSSRRARIAPETARSTIEELYHRYPQNVRGLFELNAEELQKHEEGKKTGEAILSFLNSMSIKCSSCGELIPEKIAECPYCSTLLRVKKDVEVDPLKILKLRYAKGEITKEQYEEMKKTLMAS